MFARMITSFFWKKKQNFTCQISPLLKLSKSPTEDVQGNVIKCLVTTRGAEMDVKAVLFFRGQLSSHNQATLILIAKMVLMLFFHIRLKTQYV